MTSGKFPIHELEISDYDLFDIFVYDLFDKTSRKFPIHELEISDLFSRSILSH